MTKNLIQNQNIDKFDFICPINGYTLNLDFVNGNIECKNTNYKSNYYMINFDNKYIPVLIDEENSDTVFDKTFLVKERKVEEKNKFFLLDFIKQYYVKLGNFLEENSKRPYENIANKYIKYLSEKGKNRCIIVGSGNRDLPNRLYNQQLNTIGFDLFPGEKVDFIADAHYIPLKENSVNIIFIQAILEHVIEPHKVVDECERILDSEGIIISEVPFLQAIHEKEYDFFRYTPSAHAILYKNFEILQIGPLRGSGTTFVWALRGFLSKLIGVNFSKIITTPFFLITNIMFTKPTKNNWDNCK